MLILIHKKGAKNSADQADLGTVEVWIDQGSNWPMKRCEFTKVKMTKDRVDHKPKVFVSVVSITHSSKACEPNII